MSLLVAPLVLLWPGAIAAALLDGRRRAVALGAGAILAAVVVVLAALLIAVADGDVVTTVAGGWPADVGIRLRADALGALFAVVSAAIVLSALAHGILDGVPSRAFPALSLTVTLGLTGLFLTGDVFSFYVFFELAMISSYALAGLGTSPRQAGAALIFVVVNLIGSFLFLIAIAALYRVTGTLEMDAAAARMAAVEPTTALLIAVTFFVAFGIKLGLFPFHFWLPAVYASAPPAVAAILAGALANIGAYGLLRFGTELLPRELALADAVLVALGAVSIAYGALQAIARRDTREVLAYSAIGHAGYVLVALGIGGAVGLAAAVVFSVGNALNKALLFLAADLRGPVVAIAFAVGAFSVAGVPPTAGFFGKAALFQAGVEVRSGLTVALLFAGGALSFVYLFQVYQHDHWRPDPGARTAPVRLRVVPAVLAAAVLAVGLWPQPLLAIGDRAAGALAVEAAR